MKIKIKKQKIFLFSFLFSIFYILYSSVSADWRAFRNDPARTGFSSEIGRLDSIGLRWKYVISSPPSSITFSSPVIGDINNDGKLEIVIGADNGNIYVLQDVILKPGPPDSAEAKLLWTYVTGSCIQSTPLLIDLNGDNILEVVFGSYDDSVYAVDGFGNPVWMPPFGTNGCIFSSPIGGDIDEDGWVEIIVGSDDSCLYVLWGFDGSLKWKYKTGGMVKSSPALGDIDGDDTLEIVVGSYDNKLYAFNYDGSVLWSYITGNKIYSTPAIGDLDNDGDLDVVVGSYDGYVYALDGSTGTTIWPPFDTKGWIGITSPTLADIDADGILEIIIGSGGGERLYCLEGDSGLLKWSINPTLPQNHMIRPSCAIADINSNGALEIVLGTHDFYCRAFESNGDKKWNYPLLSDPHSSPALGDIDGDGQIEVVVATLSGQVFVLDWPVDPDDVEETENAKYKMQNAKLEVYPNPFTQFTVISFQLSDLSKGVKFNAPTASLTIYDLAGQLVRTLFDSELSTLNSQLSVVWDGADNLGKRVSPGIYFCKLAKNGTQKEYISTKLIYIR